MCYVFSYDLSTSSTSKPKHHNILHVTLLTLSWLLFIWMSLGKFPCFFLLIGDAKQNVETFLFSLNMVFSGLCYFFFVFQRFGLKQLLLSTCWVLIGQTGWLWVKIAKWCNSNWMCHNLLNIQYKSWRTSSS